MLSGKLVREKLFTIVCDSFEICLCLLYFSVFKVLQLISSGKLVMRMFSLLWFVCETNLQITNKSLIKSFKKYKIGFRLVFFYFQSAPVDVEWKTSMWECVTVVICLWNFSNCTRVENWWVRMGHTFNALFLLTFRMIHQTGAQIK